MIFVGGDAIQVRNGVQGSFDIRSDGGQGSGGEPPAGAPPAPVLSAEEVAAWLGLHPATVQQHARAGRLPARRIGKEWRFGAEHVRRARAGAERVEPQGPPGLFAGASGEVLSAGEAAAFLQVRRETVYAEAAAGRLPGWREMGRWRFDRGELAEFLRGGGEAEGERYRRAGA